MTKKIFIFLGLIVLMIVAVVGYGYISSKYNIGFPCAINSCFGIYCPGCGLTRAGIAMLHFDFAEAFRYNAFSLILLPLVFIVLASFIWEYVFDKASFISRVPIVCWVVLFTFVSIYGIMRNFIVELQPI